jgi:hypothetical protein
LTPQDFPQSPTVAAPPEPEDAPKFFCAICRTAHNDVSHACGEFRGDLFDSLSAVVDRALGQPAAAQPSAAVRSPQAFFELRYELFSGLIRACSAMRSYAAGNQSPTLASDVAGHLDQLIKKVLGEGRR